MWDDLVIGRTRVVIGSHMRVEAIVSLCNEMVMGVVCGYWLVDADINI